jgi:hypothetical protein
MTETNQKTEPQPVNRFPRVVTGGAHKLRGRRGVFEG